MGPRVQTLGGFLAIAVIAMGTLVMSGMLTLPAAAGNDASDAPARAGFATTGSGGPTGNGGVTDLAAAATGRALFLSTCATCHGADGRGGAGGPSLASSGAAAWDFYLSTGRMPLSGPGQPADRQGMHLDRDQIDALVAYGTTISSGPAIPNVVVDDASVQRGRDLFVNTCAACHGATAAGGAVGPGVFAPSLVGTDPVTVAEAVRIGPGAMPPFSWDDASLSDVAAYLDWLATAPTPGGLSTGGQGPVPEGLIAVVIGLGVLVLVARWIGNKARQPHG